MRSPIRRRMLTYLLLVVGTIPVRRFGVRALGRRSNTSAPAPDRVASERLQLQGFRNAIWTIARHPRPRWRRELDDSQPPNVDDPCFITHQDGTWDVGLVQRGAIDGRAGAPLRCMIDAPIRVSTKRTSSLPLTSTSIRGINDCWFSFRCSTTEGDQRTGRNRPRPELEATRRPREPPGVIPTRRAGSRADAGDTIAT